MERENTFIQKQEIFIKESGNMEVKKDRVVYILEMETSTMECFRIITP